MSVTSYIRIALIAAILGMPRMACSQSMGSWSPTGPVTFPVNQSGQVHGMARVSQIKFHPTNSQKVYAVSASGGVYLTANNGASWAPMAGTEVLPLTNTSSICINQSNDRTLYLCLGDADYYSSDYGIFKSLDGGLTWNAANTGIGTNMAVEILMDPTDTNKLVAATNGGIYKTTNGGASWSQVQTGAFRDMKAKPVAGGQTLYAATSTGFFYSTNFGTSWTSVTLSGLPSGNGGIRIAVTPADTARVYLLTTGGNGVVYSSATSGTSFSQVYNSSSQCLVCYDASVSSGSQGNYNIDLNAHPTKPNELLVVAHVVWRSTDGGVTWSKRTSWWNECHTDMHQIEWNPYNISQIWNANDGGVWISTDTLATSWIPRSDGLGAMEIYHASQSPITRELISIGTQDNGELYYNSTGWKTNRGGDWTYRSTIDYRSGGNVWYLETGKRRTLAPLGSDQSYNSPLAVVTGTFSTNNARIAFAAGVPTAAYLAKDTIYRSLNTNSASPSWTLLKASTATVRDITFCSADSNIVYVAAAPNILYRSDNALAATPTWTTLTTPASINATGSIATTRNNASVVFMACGNTVYRSTDKGATWTNITGTGLSGLNIRKIIHDDYSTRQRLFVNAGSYVHYKDSTTTAWTNHSTSAGLPSVANGADLMIYNDGTSQSILRLATFGRGVWQTNINDNSPPVVAFSANKTSICLGDTVQFSHTISGGFTSLAWSFPGGTPSSSTALSPLVKYTASGTYPVTLIATNSFGSDTLTKLAYIDVSVGSKLQVVEGFEGPTFPPAGWQASAGTGWVQTSTAGGFGGSTRSMLWDNFSVDGGGVPDRMITQKVNLSGIRNAQLKFDVAYAPYSALYPDSLRVRVSADCGATWTTVYNKTGSALATASALTTAKFVPSSAQWRTETVSLTPFIGSSIMVSFEDIGHFGQALYLDNININMSPKALFGANDTTICQGGQVSFLDSSLNASSWSWTFAGGTPASSTSQNPVVSYSTPGNYTVRLIAVNALGSDTVTRIGHVVVSANPIVNLGNDTTVCAATPVTLNAGNPGSIYLFSNAATTQTTTVTTAGAFSVAVTNAAGCVGRDTINIIAAPTPVVNLGRDTALCPGAGITLNAGNSGSSYLYNTSATTQTLFVNTPGTYSVRVTNAGGCIGRDTIVISTAAAPVVNLGNDTTLCPGSTITLNAGNPGSSYLFSNSATTQTTAITSPGTYSVVVTSGVACLGRDTIIITAASNPVVNLGNDTTLCPGTTITLNAGNPGSSYLFSNSAVTQTTSIGAAGTYSVRVTNSTGCVGRDTIVLLSGTKPAVNLGNDTALCPGATLTLDAKNPGASYLFSTGATTQTINAGPGTYSVRVTNSQLCVGRDTIIIAPASYPLVNLGRDTALCPGMAITVDAGNPGASYLYSTGATTRTLSIAAPGTYTVVVTSGQNCTGADTIVIRAGVVPAPVISAAGGLLSTGAASSYQWFRNGTAIAGATGSSYQATLGGSYRVQVKSADGCTGTSDAYVYTAASVGPMFLLTSFEVFPNPSSGEFTMTASGVKPGSMKVRCFNLAGQLVREEAFEFRGGIAAYKVNWSPLPAGVYNLEVHTGSNVPLRRKLVIH